MKRMNVLLILLVILSFGFKHAQLEDIERQKAVTELTKSRQLLVKTVKGLSESQWHFKPSEASWSVAECMEHLAISESSFANMMEEALKTPADPTKRNEVKITDDQLMGMIADRSNKVKTAKPFEPSGKLGTHKDALKSFLAKRKKHIKYVKTTHDDLRHHYAQFPFGTVDALQTLLFISAHTERHVAQMQEVMGQKNFPRD